jgi:hypothetical protein
MLRPNQGEAVSDQNASDSRREMAGWTVFPLFISQVLINASILSECGFLARRNHVILKR